MPQLFRDRALRHRLTKQSGTVLNYSRWTRPVSAASAALSAGFIILIIFGHYTRAVAISGYLVPEGGILRVFAPQPGIIVEKRIKAGDHVAKGQPLFVLSADREGREQEPLYAQATASLRDRRAKMADTIEKTRGIQQAELARIQIRRQEAIQRRTLLDDKIATMVEAIKLRSAIFERKKDLADRKLGTVDQSEQVELGLLDQRTQLSGLRLDRATLTEEIAGLDSDMAEKPLQQRNEISGLQRELSALDQQLAESETRGENVIVAPAGGVLSVDLATLGQSVMPSQPLAVIQPEGAALQVHLFAPSRAIGFIKPDERVNLRYQAFPYQKFGQQEGRVRSIARTALSAAELASLNLPQQDQNEPLYRIVVEPRRQAIEVYGQETPLQAGMTVDAYVLQETRAIYEWMLEPLLSVRSVSMSSGAADAH
ncbi:HlyD family secretion protein [Bradyrhizobium sp.]|uniref:HlyD family secretion protein n=1 Tax=Bradyrhizobium sp. TaxID=376 RepID=UPI003C6AF6C1